MKYATLAVLALLATPALAQGTAPFAPLAPEQARSNVGQNVVIAGRAHVRDAGARQGVYIDLGHSGGSENFAGYIPNENLAIFPDLRAVEGRMVNIKGVVQIRKEGFPVIIMTQASQLQPAG